MPNACSCATWQDRDILSFVAGLSGWGINSLHAIYRFRLGHYQDSPCAYTVRANFTGVQDISDKLSNISDDVRNWFEAISVRWYI